LTCGSPGKHPRIRSWQIAATTDIAQLRAWWRSFPFANIGIATGSESRIIVVDVDPRHGGDASVAKLGLPETYTVQTGGGGRHLYFQHPGVEVPNSAGRVGLGIDIRGDGGFVIAPPSNHASGNKYEVITNLPIAPFPQQILVALAELTASVRGVARPERRSSIKATAGVVPFVVAEGSRNEFLASEAGRLRRLGLEGDELARQLMTINAARCSPPLGGDEIAAIAMSISRYEGRGFALTDLGNAERFVAQHGARVRYCAQQRSWYIWDERRWKRDVVQLVKLLATLTVRVIYLEAAEEADEKSRKAIAEHAKTSESSGRVTAMVTLAQILGSVAIRADVLDTDPWLLNVFNGTLDLRTGELRPHEPRDLITKLAPVAYDPSAVSQLWESFLQDVTGGDGELAGYLQRAAGYSLTGRPTEHAVFFVFGPPATGKSKFTGGLKDVLGDYAIQTAFETFLSKRFGGGGSNDIADLAGARFVLATEADRGRHFAEATLKQLTGGDTVRARHLYESNFEFKPQFTLWLAANDAPQVNNDDDAIFRRMNIIPFTRTVPAEKQDKDLGDKLAAPEVRAAILAWAVQGCLAWQKDGLQAPRLVSDATVQYREEQDPLQFFLDESCVLELDRVIVKAKLQQAYVTWAKAAGVRYLLSPREFTKRIAKIPGVQDSRGSGGVRIWRGIDVRESWEGAASR
jgi:putative DNA primase/helicase